MFTSIFQDTMVEENWTRFQGELGAVPVLFPIGVIEEHGPHLPLGSDIYWSYAMCRLVKDKLAAVGRESVIAPPYYWGVNHCTGCFPGTFSLKPETMRQVLFELFENMKGFSFRRIYCFNYHGDSAHVGAVADALKRANSELGLSCKLILSSMDLGLYGWRGDESFLSVIDPPYPMEWFDGEDPAEAGLLDIHAGAFETGVMNCFCPTLVDLEAAMRMKSTSLDMPGLQKWQHGGEEVKEVAPLGYAGNPAGYPAVSAHVREMLELQVEEIVKQITGS